MNIRIPIIAVVGRPNVGKSTFFNRVVGSKKAIVEDEPGITRDKNYASVEGFSIPFYLIDTGGIDTTEGDELQLETRKQAISAVEEADSVIFLVDGRAGVQPADEDVLNILRSKEVPFVVVTNKCDGIELESLTADFYTLGVPEVLACSALHNRKVVETIEEVLGRLPTYNALMTYQKERELVEKEVAAKFESRLKEGKEELLEAEGWFALEEEGRAELLEKVDVTDQVDYFPPVFTPGEGVDEVDYEKEYATLPVPRHEVEEDDGPEGDFEVPTEEESKVGIIRTAIIGRPNVGKSTLLNALVGKNCSIVSSIAGTTRDSIHEMFEYGGETFELIDTAGMRKKGRIGDTVERYSVLRSLRAITECDVAVVLLSAEEGPTDQDAKIVGLAHDQGKGIVLVVNKWDAIEKDHTSVKKFEQNIRDTFKFVPYAPLIFISAKNGRRITRVLDEALGVAIARTKRVTTMRLNQMLRKEITRVPAPVERGRQLKLYYAAQVDVAPPRFMLVMNYPKQAHFSYLRFIKNVIRDKYGFSGTDIKLVTKKRGGGKAMRE
jgi:GTP-binding protein